MTLNLRIRIIVWWKGKLKGGGGEPLKGSMGGNVPMAPLKPDHVLKGDVFGSCKKKLVLMLPHCPYQSTPSIFKQRLKKTLK